MAQSIGFLSETSPMLPHSSDAAESEADIGQPQPKKRSNTSIVFFILLYVALFNIGNEMIATAQTRVFEDIFCQIYYAKNEPEGIGSNERGVIDEKWCKIGPVQSDVAMLKGWQLTLDGIGSKFRATCCQLLSIERNIENEVNTISCIY